MNDEPHDAVVSFRANSVASFILQYEDGRARGWPLHYLSTWSLSADGRTLDLLLVDADPPTRIALRGQNLGEIADALASGGGGTAVVCGSRYLSLASPERAYVVSAEVRRTQGLEE